MTRVDAYREMLRSEQDWIPLLLRESRLPGPRGNLELARAVAEEGDEELFEHLRSFGAEKAPANTPGEFLAFCGVLGLGKLLVEGQREAWQVLRPFASDPRWRVREAVAMALQRLGKADMETLLAEMERWAKGNSLEQRAAAAALCEPALLRREAQVRRVLGILDAITTSLACVENRRHDGFRALRKGLGYCWSVAVVAAPEVGKKAMQRWLASDDPDVRWVMRENLGKSRLLRMDAEWVEKSRRQLEDAR